MPNIRAVFQSEMSERTSQLRGRCPGDLQRETPCCDGIVQIEKTHLEKENSMSMRSQSVSIPALGI